jgi:hypothetical protein
MSQPHGQAVSAGISVLGWPHRFPFRSLEVHTEEKKLQPSYSELRQQCRQPPAKRAIRVSNNEDRSSGEPVSASAFCRSPTKPADAADLYVACSIPTGWRASIRPSSILRRLKWNGLSITSSKQLEVALFNERSAKRCQYSQERFHCSSCSKVCRSCALRSSAMALARDPGILARLRRAAPAYFRVVIACRRDFLVPHASRQLQVRHEAGLALQIGEILGLQGSHTGAF